MREHLRNHMADGVLCLCAGVGLCFSVYAGFVLEPPWDGNLLAACALGAVVQLLMLVFSYSRRLTGAGIAAAVAAGVLAVLLVRKNRLLADGASNSAVVFFLVTVLIMALVFLLGRTRWGAAVLFLLGVLVGAGSQFLQFPAPAWSLPLFTCSAAVLFLCRCYAVSARRAELGGTHLAAYLRQAGLLCLAALVLAAGLYQGVIAPLEPPTQDLRLIQTLKSMEWLRVLGVSSVQTMLDTEQTSDQPPDQSETHEEQTKQEAPDQQPEADPEESAHSGAVEQASAIRYREEARRVLLLAALAVLLILAALAALCPFLRWLWRRRLRGCSDEEACLRYYRFFLSRLGRAGIRRRKEQTLREFTAERAYDLQAYEAEGVTFEALTAVYERLQYGGGAVSQEEVQQFVCFYRHFYENLRRELGAVRYYLQCVRF